MSKPDWKPLLSQQQYRDFLTDIAQGLAAAGHKPKTLFMPADAKVGDSSGVESREQRMDRAAQAFNRLAVDVGLKLRMSSIEPPAPKAKKKREAKP